MEQVFNDLRNNPPKPLAESSYLKRLPVHERYVSTLNFALMDTDSSAAKTTMIEYRSMPNLKFRLVSSDVRRLESSEHSESKSLMDCKQCPSTLNIPVCQNLDSGEIGGESTANLKCMQVTSDIQKHDDSEISLEGRLCEPTPNIPAGSSVRPNLDGDGPELRRCNY